MPGSNYKTSCAAWRAGNFKVTLFGSTVNRVLSADLLGVCFDSRLTFKSHINKLNIKFLTRLNFLGVIKSMGANLNSLLLLYKSLIRPLPSSGYCALYCRSSALEQLERMQMQCIRKITGTIRWTPASILRLETGIIPISAYIHDQVDKAIVRFGQSALLDELKTLRRP
jgi:hypothetical protein